MKKVDVIETYVSGLNTKINEKFSGLDSKLDAIMLSLSEATKSGPTVVERDAQLDQLILLRLKHIVEEFEAKYNEILDHYLDTITTMLKVHHDMIGSTNELIKQTNVRHEKQMKRLEKEIQKKDEMNLIMQNVLIMLLRACWNIMDVPNHKFGEMLSILSQLFDHLKALGSHC